MLMYTMFDGLVLANLFMARGRPLEKIPSVGQAERNPPPPGQVPLRERIRSAFRRAETRRKKI